VDEREASGARRLLDLLVPFLDDRENPRHRNLLRLSASAGESLPLNIE